MISLPSLSVADLAVSEGNFQWTFAEFRVTLSSPVSHPVTVKFETVDGTAAAQSD